MLFFKKQLYNNLSLFDDEMSDSLFKHLKLSKNGPALSLMHFPSFFSCINVFIFSSCKFHACKRIEKIRLTHDSTIRDH